jgi:hypothetical protein
MNLDYLFKLKEKFMILRIVITTILVGIIQCMTIAQSQDWKQIDSPFRTSIYIVHQTSQGHLFGKMNHTNQIFFSNDRGQNWRQLPDEFGLTENKNFAIKEDNHGNIFHAQTDGVYNLNLLTLISKRIINLSDIMDFAILKNGNFITATNRNLILYAGHATISHQHNWMTHSAHFLLDPTGQKHFVLNSHGASDEIVEFNDDLSYISEDKPIQIKSIVVRSGSRLFREKTFSEDGVNWQSINILSNKDISSFNAGHDGRLFFVS